MYMYCIHVCVLTLDPIQARQKAEAALAEFQSALLNMQGEKEVVIDSLSSELVQLREQLLLERKEKDRLQLSFTEQLEATKLKNGW